MLWRQVAELLRNPNFRWLWLGDTVSLLGSSVSLAALPLLIWATTHSMEDTGLTLTAIVAPALLIGPWLLHYVEGRWNRKIVLVGTDLLRALAMILIVISHNVSVIMVLAFLVGAASSLYFPTRQAIIPEVVGPDRLTIAVSLASLSGSGVMLIGPSLGGVLVAIVGAQWAITVDAISYVMSAVANGVAHYPLGDPHARGERADAPPQTARVFGGLAVIFGDPWLRFVSLGYMAVAVLSGSAPLLILVAAHRVPLAHNGGYGLLLAFLSAGTMLGSVGAARIPEQWRTLLMTAAVPALVAFLVPTLLGAPWIGVAMSLVGFGLMEGLYNVFGSVIYANRTPLALRSKVYSQGTALTMGSNAGASSLEGWLVGFGGPTLGLSIVSGLALIAWVSGSWRLRPQSGGENPFGSGLPHDR